MDHIALELVGIRKRRRREGRGGGRLFEGGDNPGTAIIRGNTVTLKQYFGVFFDSNVFVFLEFKSNSKKRFI